MSKQHRRNADMVAVGLGVIGLCLAVTGLFASPSHASDLSPEQVEQAVQLFQGIRTNPTTHDAAKWCVSSGDPRWRTNMKS